MDPRELLLGLLAFVLGLFAFGCFLLAIRALAGVFYFAGGAA